MEKPIIIIGSGPAGLAARAGAKEMGKNAVILEKADRPSLKLLASGGTKCNFSNMLSREDFMIQFMNLHQVLTECRKKRVIS